MQIKTHQLLGGAHEQSGRLYSEAIDSAMNTLIRDVHVIPGHEKDFVTIGQYSWGSFTPIMEHLVRCAFECALSLQACFAGGMLALGSRLLGRTADLDIGLRFADTCAWAYESSASGVGPESLTFYGNDDEYRYQEMTDDTDGSKFVVPRGTPPGVRLQRAGYRGRPETTESLFYAYRITGDVRWQDKAWSMFVALVENCATEHGLAALLNVDSPAPRQDDVQGASGGVRSG